MILMIYYFTVPGVPPIAADSQNSYLGRAFKQAADRVDARVEFDHFNPSGSPALNLFLIIQNMGTSEHIFDLEECSLINIVTQF